MKNVISATLVLLVFPVVSYASLKSDCIAAAKQDHPQGHIIRAAVSDEGYTATVRFREQGLTHCEYVKDAQTGEKQLQVKTIYNCYTIVNWEQSVFGTYTPCDSAPRLQ